MDYIYFRITGEHLDLPSMIENIGIKPEKLYHKGERYRTRPIGDIPAKEKEYDFDGFMSMIECDFKDTEKQLERLIEQLYQKKEFLLVQRRGILTKIILHFLPRKQLS